MKLTKAQKEVLQHCTDWIDTWEIAHRRLKINGSPTQQSLTRPVCKRLQSLGLLEYGKENDTYRITEAGRAVLERGKLPS